MLSKSLSTSEKFAALAAVAGELGEFCQALYPLIVAHSDDFGRLQGDTFTVKHMCYPASLRSLDEFASGLEALQRVELIGWYGVQGKRYIQVLNFDSHQLGLHKRTKSQFPEFPGSSGNFPEVPGDSRKFPEIPAQEKRREEKGTEGKRTELEQRRATPLHERVAKARVQTNALKAQTTELHLRFEEFWAHWPKRRARQDAEKAWDKLHPSLALTEIILRAVDVQKTSTEWLKNGGQYIPLPATWLNGRRWDDDLRGPPVLSDRTLRLAQASKEFLES
jgi:hypothetical protein